MRYEMVIFGTAGIGLMLIGGLAWANAWLSISRRILERVPEKELSAYMQRRGRICFLTGAGWLAAAAAQWFGLWRVACVIFYLTAALLGIWRICCCNKDFTGFYTLI